MLAELKETTDTLAKLDSSASIICFVMESRRQIRPPQTPLKIGGLRLMPLAWLLSTASANFERQQYRLT